MTGIIIKEKLYHYDDELKVKARAHQFTFRENELNDFYDEKNPEVILTPALAKLGLIFCDVCRLSTFSTLSYLFGRFPNLASEPGLHLSAYPALH